MDNARELLEPKSIAIVGASRDKKKLGRIILDNIIEGGFEGELYPVNLKSDKVANLKAYKKVSDIDDVVDLAIIAVPAAYVLEVVENITQNDSARSIVIISAGFSEIGEAGLELEYKIKTLLSQSDISLLGPNCLGFINTDLKLNATFAESDMKKGSIAFVSQSGALGTAALDTARSLNLGFAFFVSLGNKCDISENELISYFNSNDRVKLISLYLEDFANGKEFMEVASKSTKPIIILKPGKSTEAQEALGSHTGSLAQSDEIIQAALEQSNVVRADSIEELFHIMNLFSTDQKMDGKRVAIVTNAGGPGVITTDAVSMKGLELVEFSINTQKALKESLPKASNIKNPIDVLGDAKADRFKITLDILERDTKTDAILVLLTPQIMTEVEKTAEIIVQVAENSQKMIIASFIGGDLVDKGKKILEKGNVPVFNYPTDAVETIGNIYAYKNSQSIKNKKEIQLGISDSNNSKVRKILNNSKGALEGNLSEKILKEYGIPLVPSHFAVDIADCRRVADKYSYPVVLKLIHPEMLHKTEENAVILNIKDETELEKSYHKLTSIAEKHKLEEAKIQVQPFIDGALEVIVGIKKDADQYCEIDGEKIIRKEGFGHTLLFGHGGIYAEVYKDFSLKVLPLKEGDATSLIKETNIGQIIEGYRGIKYNMLKLKDIIYRLDKLVSNFSQIEELDINPLFLKDDKVWVADVKIILD